MGPLVLCVCLCLSIAPQSSAEAVEIRLNPVKEQPLRFLVAQDIATQMKFAGTEIGMKLSVEMEMKVSFREEAQGLYQFDVLFERVGGTIDSPLGGKTEFYSEDGKSEYPGLFNPKVLQLKTLTGKTIQAFVSATGAVDRVEGYAEIFAGTEIEQELKRGGELLTNESFRDDVQMLFVLLPAGAVRKSEGWETPFPMNLFENEITFHPRHELVEATETLARWTFLAAGENPDAAEEEKKAAEAGAQKPRAFVTSADVRNASLNGEAVVSRKDGLPLRQAFELVLEIQLPSPVSEGLIPTVLNQRVETRRLDAPSKDG